MRLDGSLGRALLWPALFLAALLAVLFAASLDRGYVVVVFPPWRVEMSFVLGLVLTFAAFVLTYMVAKLLRVALRLPADVRAWREKRRRDKAEDELSRAIAALIAGQHRHARELADQALAHDPTPLAALVAARGALDAGDTGRAREYLERVEGEVGEVVAARRELARRAEAAP